MYINAIGYYSEDDCLKNNIIKHETQTQGKAVVFFHNAITRSLLHLPYDITAIDMIIFMSDARSDEFSRFIKQEYNLRNTKILRMSSESTLINSLELINSYFLSKLSNKALLIYIAEEAVACFFSNEKIIVKEGRLISISHAPIEHKRSKSLCISYIKSELEMNGYFLSDLSYLLFNDPGNKVIKSVIASLNIPEDKILVNVDNSKNKHIEPFFTLAQNYENFKTNDLIYIPVFRESILMGSFLLEMG